MYKHLFGTNNNPTLVQWYSCQHENIDNFRILLHELGIFARTTMISMVFTFLVLPCRHPWYSILSCPVHVKPRISRPRCKHNILLVHHYYAASLSLWLIYAVMHSITCRTLTGNAVQDTVMAQALDLVEWVFIHSRRDFIIISQRSHAEGWFVFQYDIHNHPSETADDGYRDVV